jgi:hypothetical protein
MRVAATIVLAALGLAGTAACGVTGHTGATGTGSGTGGHAATTVAVGKPHSQPKALTRSAAPAPVATASQPSSTATANQSTVASVQRASTKTVVFDCLNHPIAEPGTYVLTCADYGSILEHLNWQSWTSTSAVATGVHSLNDCTPDCAVGKFIDYPAVITFWRAEPLAGHSGEKYFTRITVRYTGQRPPAYMSYNTLINHPAQWSEVLGS